MDFINIKPEKKASDGGSVAGMWSEWNEGRTASRVNCHDFSVNHFILPIDFLVRLVFVHP